jgi:hypothetical protein
MPLPISKDWGSSAQGTAGEDKENTVKDCPIIQAGLAATRGMDGHLNQRPQKRPEPWSDELSLHARRTYHQA